MEKFFYEIWTWLGSRTVTLSRWKRIIKDWQHKISPNGLISHLLSSLPLLFVRNKMVRLTIAFPIRKTNDPFPFRFNLWSCSAAKANCGCKNGSPPSQKRVRKRWPVNWLPISWPVSQRCAHFWSGKISKLFTKGTWKLEFCLFSAFWRVFSSISIFLFK